LQMGVPMTTKNDIQLHIIDYFAWRFNAQRWDFTEKTNVRKRFKSAAAWEALADTFNDAEWMKDLGVVLDQDEMDERKTIGDLTDLIYGKYSNT